MTATDIEPGETYEMWKESSIVTATVDTVELPDGKSPGRVHATWRGGTLTVRPVDVIRAVPHG